MAEDRGQIAEYVGYVVEQLVSEPDAIEVSQSVEGNDLFVDVTVAPDDRGRIIGRGGRLIRSLRVVIRAAAGRDGMNAMLDLVEDEDVVESGAAAGDAAQE